MFCTLVSRFRAGSSEVAPDSSVYEHNTFVFTQSLSGMARGSSVQAVCIVETTVNRS